MGEGECKLYVQRIWFMSLRKSFSPAQCVKRGMR